MKGSSCAVRISNLQTGISGGFRLNGHDAAGGVGTQTVFSDDSVDVLTRSSGRDWFLLNNDSNGGPRDRVTDLASGETASDIDFNIL